MVHQLQRAVGDHLVRVHVGRRAGAALKDIELEFAVELAVDQLLTGAFDAGRDLAAELTALEVGARGRHLHHPETFDEIGVVCEVNAGDVEVLQGPGGLHTVVGVGRYGLVAKEVVFQTCGGGGWHFKLPENRQTDVFHLAKGQRTCQPRSTTMRGKPVNRRIARQEYWRTSDAPEALKAATLYAFQSDVVRTSGPPCRAGLKACTTPKENALV